MGATTVANPPKQISQRTGAWCFAAAELMVRHFYHLATPTQYEIASKLFEARAQVDPAVSGDWQMASILDLSSGQETDGGRNLDSHRVRLIRSSFGALDQDATGGRFGPELTEEIVRREIDGGDIIVIGSQIHYMVVIGYAGTGNSFELEVLDPWPVGGASTDGRAPRCVKLSQFLAQPQRISLLFSDRTTSADSGRRIRLKAYTLLFDKRRNTITFPVKATHNLATGTEQFAGGYPAMFGGNVESGEDCGAALGRETLEESRGTWSCTDDADFQDFYTDRNGRNVFAFFATSDFEEVGAWPSTPPTRYEEGEMSMVVTVPLRKFRSASPDEFLHLLCEHAGAPGGDRDQSEQFFMSRTARAFELFIAKHVSNK